MKVPRERRDWGKAQLEALEETRLAALQAALDSDGRLEAEFSDGELQLWAGGAPVLQTIFLEAGEDALVLPYWRWLLLDRRWRKAKEFAEALRAIPAVVTNAAETQFRERVDALEAETAAIEQDEERMDELLFTLYGLNADERRIVENARKG